MMHMMDSIESVVAIVIYLIHITSTNLSHMLTGRLLARKCHLVVQSRLLRNSASL